MIETLEGKRFHWETAVLLGISATYIHGEVGALPHKGQWEVMNTVTLGKMLKTLPCLSILFRGLPLPNSFILKNVLIEKNKHQAHVADGFYEQIFIVCLFWNCSKHSCQVHFSDTLRVDDMIYGAPAASWVV
jgi:hypothetical protein